MLRRPSRPKSAALLEVLGIFSSHLLDLCVGGGRQDVRGRAKVLLHLRDDLGSPLRTSFHPENHAKRRENASKIEVFNPKRLQKQVVRGQTLATWRRPAAASGRRRHP